MTEVIQSKQLDDLWILEFISVYKKNNQPTNQNTKKTQNQKTPR